MKANLKLAIKAILYSSLALAVNSASASDKELLQTLYENGVLNQSQYEKLLAQEKQKTAEKSAVSSSTLKAMDWASRVKITGDMRFRQEFRDSNTKASEKNRTRIRARLGLAAKVNDEVGVGFRLVTAGGRTSSNQTLEGGFGGKDIFFDRAFLKWTPTFAYGASVTAGKFKQPWFRVTDNIWDGDINPEGIALAYEQKIAGVKLAATGGYFILSNDDKGSFSDDMNLYHAGISGQMEFNKMVKAALGFNTYLYNGTTINDYLNCETGKTCPDEINGFGGDNMNGDPDADFKLFEVAGKVDIKTGLLPLKIFGNYVVNTASNIKDGEDSAWMLGAGTKYLDFKLSYDYRDTEVNAVPDTFNDSDFNAGATGSNGHRIKLGYGISKNFSLGLAYLLADEYVTRGEGVDGTERDTLQIDLKAKF